MKSYSYIENGINIVWKFSENSPCVHKQNRGPSKICVHYISSCYITV